MRLTGPALRLTVFVTVDDRHHHQPLYHEIVTRARAAGLAGATSLVHTDRLLDVADNLPAVVIIVDAEDRVRGFLSQLDELVDTSMVVLEQVEVLRYTGHAAPGARS